MDKQIFGTYKLGQQIASSNHSHIYDISNKDKFVIKVLNEKFADEDSYLGRFKNTIERIAHLTHPNIGKIHDYGIDGVHGFVVLPRLTPIENQYSPAKTLKILLQVASAIEEAHYQGIIHGNLHTDNVLLDDSGQVVVTDFGIATVLRETLQLLAQDTLIGNPAFIAPEQWKSKNPSAATDIYALGILAYQLLTGNLPFEASTIGAVKYQHLNESLPSASERNPELPNGVDAILRHALEKSPIDRYRSTTQFIQELSATITGETIEINPPNHEKVVEHNTPQLQKRPKTISWWVRRLGCSIALLIWFLLMLSPCLIITVLVQGEFVYNLSDVPEHKIRIFDVQSKDTRGFGYSWGNIARETDDDVCVMTHVRYVVWEGESEAADYCECFEQVEENWVSVGSIEESCETTNN